MTHLLLCRGVRVVSQVVAHHDPPCRPYCCLSAALRGWCAWTRSPAAAGRPPSTIAPHDTRCVWWCVILSIQGEEESGSSESDLAQYDTSLSTTTTSKAEHLQYSTTTTTAHDALMQPHNTSTAQQSPRELQLKDLVNILVMDVVLSVFVII